MELVLAANGKSTLSLCNIQRSKIYDSGNNAPSVRREIFGETGVPEEKKKEGAGVGE